MSCIAVCCSVLYFGVVQCVVFWCVAVCCSVLQYVAVCCIEDVDRLSRESRHFPNLSTESQSLCYYVYVHVYVWVCIYIHPHPHTLSHTHTNSHTHEQVGRARTFLQLADNSPETGKRCEFFVRPQFLPAQTMRRQK